MYTRPTRLLPGVSTVGRRGAFRGIDRLYIGIVVYIYVVEMASYQLNRVRGRVQASFLSFDFLINFILSKFFNAYIRVFYKRICDLSKQLKNYFIMRSVFKILLIHY